MEPVDSGYQLSASWCLRAWDNSNKVWILVGFWVLICILRLQLLSQRTALFLGLPLLLLGPLAFTLRLCCRSRSSHTCLSLVVGRRKLTQ